MEIEPAIIGLEWIGMVEKLEGDVARRSYKDGSQAQLTLVIGDKGATKPYFEKLCENLSFLIFTKGIALCSPWQSGSRKNRALLKG